MKKLLIMAAIILTAAECTKEQKASDEVRITLTNECRCKVKIYKQDSAYLSDVFDCDYISILSIRMAKGNYVVKADNYRGKKKEIKFIKGLYQQNLDIEF